MAKWWLCLFCGAVAGCGPTVASSGGDGSASSGGAGSSSDTTSATGTTALSESSSGDGGSTGGSGSTSAAETSTDPGALCLQGAPHPTLDDVGTLLRILDTDGNGRDELWMAEELWDPVEEVQSSVLRPFELDDRGVFVALAELEVTGKVGALADIDGDGVLDAVVTQWDESASWWQAGLPGFDIDATAQPLEGLELPGTWMEITGDDFADYVALSYETGFEIFVGDGTGTFSPGAISVSKDHGPYKAYPVPSLGQLVLVFQQRVLGFGIDISLVRTVSVDANGDLQTLAESGPLDIEPSFVGDLDGDELSDVIGVDARDGDTVRYLGSARGPYEEVDIVANVRDAVVGEFAGEHEILWWDITPQWQLLPREGTTWPTVVPVGGSPQWEMNGRSRVIEADGEPGAEILRTHDTYSLWSVEGC